MHCIKGISGILFNVLAQREENTQSTKDVVIKVVEKEIKIKL